MTDFKERMSMTDRGKLLAVLGASAGIAVVVGAVALSSSVKSPATRVTLAAAAPAAAPSTATLGRDVGGLTVGDVPADLTYGTGPCDTENATVACWAGTVADPSQTAQAVAAYGTAGTAVIVSVGPAGPGLAGEAHAVTRSIAGASVTTKTANGQEQASFDVAGKTVFIRTLNEPDSVVTGIAANVVSANG